MSGRFGDFEERFWDSYSENHFWRLNDKTKVRENSVYYDAIYDRFVPESKTARILDVGCGGGHFLHYLSRKGYTAMEGIDLAPGLVRFVRDEIWPAVHQGDALAWLAEHPGAYDLVAANDFLEHLPKPQGIRFLFLCREALADGGRIFLKTPNMSHLFASRNRYVDFTHETGFTEQSLHEVLSAAGFREIGIHSEHHAAPEPKAYPWLRRLYGWMGVSCPAVLSPNLVAVASR